MTEFFQQLINGLSVGSMYALIAIGYTLVYGVLRFINFAHSDVFMVGSFAGLYIGRSFQTTSLGAGLVTMLGAMAICATLGILIERFAYRPLRNRSKLTVLITAIGVSLFLENAGQLVFGANPRPFPETFSSRKFEFENLFAWRRALVLLGAPMGLLIPLHFIVLKKKTGTARRAAPLNPKAASLMGINVNVVISFTFGLGSALAAADR